MYPYRYEPEQRPEQPLPVVNPEPVVQPRPAVQPKQVRQPRRSRWLAKMFPRIGAFVTSVVLLTLLWFGIISQVGSITGSLRFDIALWAIGILYFFYDYILTDNGFRWAEKHCVFWRK